MPLKMPIAKLDGVSFDRWLGDARPFALPAPMLDLVECHLVTPAAMIPLTVLCRHLATQGRRPVLRIGNAEVRGYLNRTGFTNIVRQWTQLDPPVNSLEAGSYLQFRGRSPVLLEVTQLTTRAALPGLLERVVDLLVRKMAFPQPDAFDMATTISELCQNTFDHATNHCGFVAMQLYHQGERPFVELAVGDGGDGLQATLSRNPRHHDLRSDRIAIRRATQAGTSQFEDPTRGTGLYHLLRIGRKHGACIQIRTGVAKIRYRLDTGQHSELTVPWMPGVQVSLTVNAKLPTSPPRA